ISVIVGFVFIGGIDTLATLVNFGALSAFLLLNVSVFYHFIVKEKRNDYWNFLALPLIGFIIIGFVWINFASLTKIMGLSWLLIGAIVAFSLAVKSKDSNIGMD